MLFRFPEIVAKQPEMRVIPPNRIPQHQLPTLQVS